MWPALIGAAGSLLGGLFNSQAQSQANTQNVEFQRETNRANRQFFLQDRDWNREQAIAARDEQRAFDAGAMQRLVDQAKAAGIHPLAALGAGNMAGSPVIPQSGGAPVDVAPQVQANTAMGDSVAQGAAQFAQIMSAQRSELENELLRAQIGVTQAQEAQLLADATSRTLVQAVRSGAVGGASPTSSNVVTIPSPFGLPDMRVKNPKLAQDAQDHFGDLVENFYGAGNWLDSLAESLRLKPSNPKGKEILEKARRSGVWIF